MKRFIRHCKKWNEWRKSCKNYLPYKIHVFFKPKISPTYQLFIRNEEMKELVDAFLKGVEEGMKSVEDEMKGGNEE